MEKQNKMKKEIFYHSPVTIGMIFLLFFFAFLAILIIISPCESSDVEVYKAILSADCRVSEVLKTSQNADNYYGLAGLSYEEGDYNGVENYCKIARGYYLDESQEYRKIKADLKNKGLDNELIDIYIKRLDALIEISEDMYEACEHFESAARYYDIYYNTDVSFDDISLDMANGEIEMMNEKISAHDRAVRRFNDLLADFEIKIEEKING